MTPTNPCSNITIAVVSTKSNITTPTANLINPLRYVFRKDLAKSLVFLNNNNAGIIGIKYAPTVIMILPIVKNNVAAINA